MSNYNYTFYEIVVIKIDAFIQFMGFIFKEYIFKIIPIATLGTLLVKTLIIVDEKKLSFLKTFISIITAIFSSHIVIGICKEYGLSKTTEVILIILMTIYSDKIAKILVIEIDISLWIKLIYETIMDETKELIKNISLSIQKKFKSNEKK